MTTLADHIATTLKAGGVQRIFGIPGGGSSLDLMDAARRNGIEFIVCRTEAAATIMAAITGEVTGIPGVALVGVGPGASSATNGLAYASIERAPMFLFIDGPASSAHQHFDQQAMYAPITKTTEHLHGDDAVARFVDAWQVSTTPPEGPAMFEFTSVEAVETVAGLPAPFSPSSAKNNITHIDPDMGDILSGAEKPIAIIGLEARPYMTRVQEFIKHHRIPAVTTYKALGVVAHDSEWFVGPATGATGEAPFYQGADLVIGIGFDPIEFIPGKWPDELPRIVTLSEAQISNPRIPITSRATGPLDALLDKISDLIPQSTWGVGELTEKRALSALMYQPRGAGFSCAHAIEVISTAVPPSTRIACDAGAHMFSTLGLWPANSAYDVLKSNGLSTMGYALPAAIAAKLEHPEKPTLAITGDGGMSMCLGELATAKEHDLDITVIVMNDAALSLIDIKQQRQQRPTTGVRYPVIDFAAVAAGFGWTSMIAASEDELRDVMAVPGPKLIDVRIDSAGYGNDLERLRG